MLRKLFWLWIAFLLVQIGSTPICLAVADVPENVILTAGTASITVTWDGDSDDDGFYVYWGTQSDSLNNRARVSDQAGDRFVISNLDPGTTYYVAVSAFDNEEESDLSAVQSINTLSDTDPPSTPEGFFVTSVDDIAQNSVGLKWDDNTESDLDVYRIYYGTASNNYDTTIDVPAQEENRLTVDGLLNATRYYFTITAVDDSDNESPQAEEIIVDTLPDNLAPFVPNIATASLSGPGEITVVIDGRNTRMADYAGSILLYGSSSGNYDQSVDVGTKVSHVVTGLPDDTTWFFAARGYDRSGNESGLSSEKSVAIEETQGFLDRSDDFDGGCFISSMFGPEEAETVSVKNKTGVSAGYYLPAESEFKDFYDDTVLPVFLFYDRKLTRHFSVDLKAGYMRETGQMLTVSGADTGVSMDYTAVPVAASLNWNFPVLPNMWGFVGVGPDYWYLREEPEKSGIGDEVSEWVGGYHGRAGFWLFNRDPEYRHWGALLECNYHQIDRFGSNSDNPGGWIFTFGIFYGF